MGYAVSNDPESLFLSYLSASYSLFNSAMNYQEKLVALGRGTNTLVVALLVDKQHSTSLCLLKLGWNPGG